MTPLSRAPAPTATSHDKRTPPERHTVATGDQQPGCRDPQQREYWTAGGPQLYQEHGDRTEELFAPFGQAVLDAARLRPGEWVLDVGCGHGTTTIQAAERVTPSGRVVGVDISAATAVDRMRDGPGSRAVDSRPPPRLRTPAARRQARSPSTRAWRRRSPSEEL